MDNKIHSLINQGYKILKFEREVDKISGQEIGLIEMKALDGRIEYIEIDDNGTDEVEKMLFNYLGSQRTTTIKG